MVNPSSDSEAPSPGLLDLTPEALAAVLAEELGQPAYRARQILQGVCQAGWRAYDDMTSLPAELRRRLAARLPLRQPEIRDCRLSEDGSRKYVLGLADGKAVEAVHIVDRGRNTFCISSQVGCAFGCDFCLTARMGLVRQLGAGEIVGQVLTLADEAGLGHERFNVVLMGMGEPLHNFDAVALALRFLLSSAYMNLSHRRITLSTVGHVEGLRRLARLKHRPRLAVSLNAAEDRLRSRMMPVNRAHPLEELMKALEAYPLRKRERITFEYVVMAGLNDAPAEADRLATLVRRVPSKVNLIPFNEDPSLPQRRPEPGVVETFRDRLLDLGVAASIRWSRGVDIRAACGQLVLEVGA